MKDIGLSAFSVFFTQCGSFLEYQRRMAAEQSSSNAESLFGIKHTPSDNHIRSMLDSVPPSDLFPVYMQWLRLLDERSALDAFRHHDNQLLAALDGLHYYTSNAISCKQCNTKEDKDGRVTYEHKMVAATLIHPDKEEVIPLVPSFVEPQDGHSKQDCELAAAKRWLVSMGPTYSSMDMTLLGDDLYCCQPLVELAIASGFHVIFVCKRDSHKTTYEHVDSLAAQGQLNEVSHKTGGLLKKRQTWICRYLNNVPLRDGDDALHLGWCEIEVRNVSGKVIYRNAFMTDQVLTDDNVMLIIEAGRARWKIENENNNTLKKSRLLLRA